MVDCKSRACELSIWHPKQCSSRTCRRVSFVPIVSCQNVKNYWNAELRTRHRRKHPNHRRLLLAMHVCCATKRANRGLKPTSTSSPLPLSLSFFLTSFQPTHEPVHEPKHLPRKNYTTANRARPRGCMMSAVIIPSSFSSGTKSISS